MANPNWNSAGILFSGKVLGKLDTGLENALAVGKDVGLRRTTLAQANLEGQNEEDNIV